ncbi:MAG: hypothetical protein DSM106950_37525 [Stigonema ocellatum SAG 48.90 = DSM 106950]|nr:hypothetical protein [Stigonema ocellatum SAG 48.90 = DSM 106950]
MFVSFIGGGAPPVGCFQETLLSGEWVGGVGEEGEEGRMVVFLPFITGGAPPVG